MSKSILAFPLQVKRIDGSTTVFYNLSNVYILNIVLRHGAAMMFQGRLVNPVQR
jgi:hypothetical protein